MNVGQVVYGDDGTPMPAPPRRGGRRKGAGRLPKPDLSEEEFQFVHDRRGGRRSHGTSWQAIANEVNVRFRWRGAIDARTRADRGISGSWLRGRYAAGIKMRQQSNLASGEPLQHHSGGAGNSGPRIDHDANTGGPP